MSMMAAIDLAVLLQLVSDSKGRDAYTNYALTMDGAGLTYSEATMSTFLQRVAMRLKCDTPSLNFDWVSVDPTRCLTADRETLINLIFRATREAGAK